MSAYVVTNEHLHVLIWAATIAPAHQRGPLTWYFGNPTEQRQLTAETLTATGQMLLDANTAAVNYRYDEAGAHTYTYRPPLHTSWSIPELLKAVHAYEYQACEIPDWATSEAHAFCRELERRLIARLPGYQQAPWGIDDTTTTAAHRN